MSLDAAAMDSSTASRRRACTAFSFSAVISWLARSSICSCSSRVLARSASRSLVAADLAVARISWACVLPSATSFLCSSRSSCASARAFSASSSCFWIRCSRSSTIWRIWGHPNFQSRPSRTTKMPTVQRITPPLMSNGVATFSAASCRTYSPSIVLGQNLEEEGEYAGDQRHAFDQRGGQNHRTADVTRRLGLPGDRLGGPRADQADADAGADGREAEPDAGAQKGVSALGYGDSRLSVLNLKQHVYHVSPRSLLLNFPT